MAGIADRYDGFQKDAVQAIEADFQDQPAGRFLLVIPTGGGKTFTAVKAVSALIDSGQIGASERVMWVMHRDELAVQARDTFEAYSRAAGKASLVERIDFVMTSGIRDYLERNSGLKFAVVDEAHHAAASSYQPLFDRAGLGILGLTATPSRHDGLPLQFMKESYSIGFPDLVDLGVLLRPEVIRVEGGRYELDDIGVNGAGLEALNNDERNGRIASALHEHRAKLEKVIIYVGTRQHARDLYAQLTKLPLAKDYESIGLILGGERRRFVSSGGIELAEDRQTFIREMKAARRSILVNVDVLTEGYDDPSVNAVVMARPTSSKLVYMQAMGRAVRQDPANPDKCAHVIEVVDDLPNIRYRIDNRWLFSDVSDLLEPAVVDEPFSSPTDLVARIEDAFSRYGVPAILRTLPSLSDRDRVTMLLFRVFTADGKPKHIPVVITNTTRQAASRFFNFLSARMSRFSGLAVRQVLAAVDRELSAFPGLATEPARTAMLNAMENAWELVQSPESASQGVRDGATWITFVSFRPRLVGLSDDLLAFTEEMKNREGVREALLSRSYVDGTVLCRLPLPLQGYWGVLLSTTEFEVVRATIDLLRLHTANDEPAGQWRMTTHVLGTATLPIASHHHSALATIVREGTDFYRQLKR